MGLLLLALVGCGGSLDSAAPEDSAAPAFSLSLEAGETVRYALSVDWGEATLEDGVRTWTTDLGYTVRLSAARVSSIGAQLDPCEVDTGLAAWSPLDLLGGPARADHVVTLDSSLYSATLVEDLLAGERQSYGTGAASGLDYCAIHWLSGPTTEDGMAGQSIHLEGSVQGPEDAEARAFLGEIWLSAGGLPELTEGSGAGALDGSEGVAAEIEILRRPTRALDGEELSALSDAEIAYAFLAGLGSAAEARVWR